MSRRGQPIVIKRKLKRKAPRSIQNEKYYLAPLRAYFGTKVAELLTLGDLRWLAVQQNDGAAWCRRPDIRLAGQVGMETKLGAFPAVFQPVG